MAGCCRFLWNKALALNLKRLEAKQTLMWYNELAFWLTFWKKTEELSFLKECHSQALQQTLKHLDRHLKTGLTAKPIKESPYLKNVSKEIAFAILKVSTNRPVFLPKIGWAGFYKSRNIEGKLKNLTV